MGVREGAQQKLAGPKKSLGGKKIMGEGGKKFFRRAKKYLGTEMKKKNGD